MIACLESSAAVKLFLEESESRPLEAFLDRLDETDVLVTSTLLETELRRAAAREGVDQSLPSAVLAGIDLVEMPRGVFTSAGLLPLPGLRSLEALHVATALRAECDLLISYDQRMLEAARMVGLPSASPS